MILYHFSNINKPTLVVKPEKFGEHNYTISDYKVSPVPRSFWYINPEDKEDFFNNKILYIVKIPDLDIYNLKEDSENIKSKYSNIDEMLSAIRRNYKGVLYNVGYDIVSLFISVKAIRNKTQPALYSIKNMLKKLLV